MIAIIGRSLEGAAIAHANVVPIGLLDVSAVFVHGSHSTGRQEGKCHCERCCCSPRHSMPLKLLTESCNLFRKFDPRCPNHSPCLASTIGVRPSIEAKLAAVIVGGHFPGRAEFCTASPASTP